MEGSVNTTEENQEKTGDDVGVSVGVYHRTDTIGGGDDLFAEEAEDFTNQGGGGDNSRDTGERTVSWLTNGDTPRRKLEHGLILGVGGSRSAIATGLKNMPLLERSRLHFSDRHP
jgi:hypothetical protein